MEKSSTTNRPKTNNLYENLGLTKAHWYVKYEIISKRRRKLLAAFHPDKLSKLDAAKKLNDERIKDFRTCIEKSCKILSDPKKRQIYNYLLESNRLVDDHGGAYIDWDLLNNYIVKSKHDAAKFWAQVKRRMDAANNKETNK